MIAAICLAGGIASGKSTLADALKTNLPHSVVRSFGDVVRSHVASAGLPITRANLQEAGLTLIEKELDKFVTTLLTDVPADVDYLVVDGVRHATVVEVIRRKLSDVRVIVVFLATTPSDLQARLRGRNEASFDLDHRVEAQVDLVRVVSDVVVDSSEPVESAIRCIRQMLRSSLG